MLFNIGEDDIGKAAFVEVASAFNLETFSRGMTHFLYNSLKAYSASLEMGQHHLESVLHQWKSGRSLRIGRHLFFQRVRSMVRSNDVDAVVEDGLQDSLAVCYSLYGGVTFDLVAQAYVVLITIVQGMRAGLRGYAFLSYPSSIKQRCLFCCGNVQNMKPGSML